MSYCLFFVFLSNQSNKTIFKWQFNSFKITEEYSSWYKNQMSVLLLYLFDISTFKMFLFYQEREKLFPTKYKSLLTFLYRLTALFLCSWALFSIKYLIPSIPREHWGSIDYCDVVTNLLPCMDSQFSCQSNLLPLL